MAASWEFKSTPLVLGIPIKGNVTLDWAIMFKNLDLPYGTRIISSQGTPIHVARNKIVSSFLDSDADWLFFLDADLHLQPNTIKLMMEKNYPLLSGLYYTRYPPIMPVCWNITSKGKEVVNFKNGDIVKADAGGAGCLLISRQVLEKLEPPYFNWTLGLRPNPSDEMSEDFYFFRKAKRAGFQLCVDTSIQCMHEALVMVDATGQFKFSK